MPIGRRVGGTDRQTDGHSNTSPCLTYRPPRQILTVGCIKSNFISRRKLEGKKNTNKKKTPKKQSNLKYVEKNSYTV